MRRRFKIAIVSCVVCLGGCVSAPDRLSLGLRSPSIDRMDEGEWGATGITATLHWNLGR